MTPAALTDCVSRAEIRIREPAGERLFQDSVTLGGTGADIVVPGAAAGAALQIERHETVWTARPLGEAHPRLNGQHLAAPRSLGRHDVITIGDAQVVVLNLTRALLHLDTLHPAGNNTVPPAGLIAELPAGRGDDSLRIHPVPISVEDTLERERIAADSRRRRWRIAALTAAGVMLTVVLIASGLHGVRLDIQPADARIRNPGTAVAVHAGDLLYVLSGRHIVRAEHDGYVPAQTTVDVRSGQHPIARLRLAKLPGTLRIDTKGVAALVSVDGAESGRAPGAIQVAAGTHTLTVRAPRYVDSIVSVEVEGAGVTQDVKVPLQPSWGTLQISVVPSGARVFVDGVDHGRAPAVVDAPSGVRQVRISAPGFKTWESSVVLRAGEALAIGPVTLGQPDAHVTVASQPSGAEVTIGGVLRGRTPLGIDLPAGIAYELSVNAPGYAVWNQQIFAEPGSQLRIDARPEAAGARVTVQGTPDGARLLIDGRDRGQTPVSIDLSAVEHQIEVRKDGWVTFTTKVTPAKGLDRTVQYQLVSQERAAAIAQKASVIYSQTGYVLKLVPLGAFTMPADGSGVQNVSAGQQRVRLQRPFYLGVAEVTNEQFRRFRVNHGLPIDRRTGSDEQPVTQVSWTDAAEFCNWLSERDNLPPAYERSGDRYVLHRPVTIGYRLPTESEWEYAVHTPPLALQDLSGRLSEWMNDYYSDGTGSSAIVLDPLGPLDGARHVLRGASWKVSSTAPQRLAWRGGSDGSSSTVGFRIARYAE
ncbi:MAG TPA: PEGA domain-containing protein [Steroidobacteraceae bacterium]|nr:PEGA domain-containing protein [Steroidobacteraceae bacterium]